MITGYICKKCENPSPIGIGYATSEPADPNAGSVTACQCGYSQHPDTANLPPLPPVKRRITFTPMTHSARTMSRSGS